MPEQRHSFGLMLVVVTLFMWGSLPLQLKILIAKIDPTTLTWYRFTGALIFLAVVGGRQCLIDVRQAWSKRVALLLLLGGIGLTLNYVTYLKGLDHLTPSTAQILMQTVPFLVLAGGILIFGESFAGRQWWGVLLLAIGSAMFFNQRLDEMQFGSSFLVGVAFILSSAVCWTTFILSQKALLSQLKSRTIMLFCYTTGVIILAPLSQIDTIVSLDATILVLVLAVTLIAVISYLTFATSMRHVPATTAGLAIANIPLITILSMILFGGRVEHLEAENLNGLAYVGAIVVVLGSGIGALGPSTKDVAIPSDD